MANISDMRIETENVKWPDHRQTKYGELRTIIRMATGPIRIACENQKHARQIRVALYGFAGTAIRTDPDGTIWLYARIKNNERNE